MTLRWLIPVVALLACAKPPAQTGTARPKSKPIAVQTVEVVEREMPSTLTVAGSLKANQESDLAANASGLVIRTMVERGSDVLKGQPIVQLDVRVASLSTKEAEANMETARTQKAQAEGECTRNERLFKRGIITQQEYDRQASSCQTASSSTAAAEMRVKLAKRTLSNNTVRAPFSGIVSERYVSVGEYVMPSTKVAHLLDIDPLRLELTIPEQNIGAVKPEQKLEFRVAAFPELSFVGVVHYIGPAVRATTRDLVFEALVQNSGKRLRPGLFATAQLDAGLQKLPVVPRAALKQDGDTIRTFAVIEKHIEERLVQVGPVQGEVTAILSGLRAGERVVVHPTEQISDGVEVE